MFPKQIWHKTIWIYYNLYGMFFNDPMDFLKNSNLNSLNKKTHLEVLTQIPESYNEKEHNEIYKRNKIYELSEEKKKNKIYETENIHNELKKNYNRKRSGNKKFNCRKRKNNDGK